MAKKTDREHKGTFGPARLSVTRTYLEPISRQPLIWIGLALAGFAILWTVLDFSLFEARFVSNGPLSSNHAAFENDCASCHNPFQAVTSETCSTCHEKHGDRLGVYTWAAHYVYRSNDFQRVVTSPEESACNSCHIEHEGREADITRAADQTCRVCHDFESFNQGHPPFDFVAEALPDRAALRFQHTQHVHELMKRESLVDVERACLYCHHAEADGKGFEPISFEKSCDACHLTTTVRTPSMPLQANANGPLGVLGFESFRDSDEPGHQWALFTSPREFRERGGEISKSPVYHPDPWILANLRRLRQKLFPEAGLADLLIASADLPTDLPAADLQKLYSEAIDTLETHALGLRSSSDRQVQLELEQIEAQLADLKRSLRDPYTPLDATKFSLAFEGGASVDDDLRQSLDNLVADLTAVCQTCHLVEDATIVRVQADQAVLARAEFDHRAHILELRCLDCHNQIPIEEHLDAEKLAKLDPALDNAEIQNLPTIENCQQCHNPRQAVNSCTTCHFFHPNKSHRSDMLLYLDTE